MSHPDEQRGAHAVAATWSGMPDFPRNSRLLGSAISLALGMLSALAFAPLGWWPLMPLAIAALCELVARSETRGRALLVGWWFGLGQSLVGLNWIATAFTYQSAMPAWLGWIAVLLVSLYLALYPALSAGLAWRLGRTNPVALVLALAGSWAITEWLRATLFTGFAWNPIGVTLVETPWLATSVFVGSYGLSALVALAGGLAWLLTRQQWLAATGIAAGLALVLALPRPMIPDQCCLAAFSRDEERPGEAPPRSESTPGHRAFHDARIVQPNIGQQDKWRPGFSEIAAQRLALLSAKRVNDNPRLLFWPEAAVTDPLEDQRPGQPHAFAQFERMRASASLGRGEYLLTGGIALFASDRREIDGAANSIFVLGQGGRLVARYDKAHLVPYGEYLPMRPLLSAIGLSRLAPGDVDFIAGPGPRTIALPGWGKVGFQICYEIIFSGEVVDRKDRPDYIFNPSNDAWFGAWGPPQHLAQARLRAAEEGLPVIRSTPTGISAVIDAHGAILKSVGWKQAGAIDAQLPPASLEATPFGRAGNVLPLSLGFALLLAAIALNRRARYRRGT